MFPYVVCRCGFPIGALYGAYKFMLNAHNNGQRVSADPKIPVGRTAPIGYILDILQITATCCRSCIMTNAEFKDYYNATSPATVPATVVPGSK